MSNSTVLPAGARAITLTKGLTAFVDDEDFDMLNMNRWTASKARNAWYAVAGINGKTWLMHRLIMNAVKGDLIDHANGNTLDNRKSNLRFCDHAGNASNAHYRIEGKTSPYRGVSYRFGRWCSSLNVDGRKIVVGYYPTEVEAAVAYSQAARLYHGSFAVVNDSVEIRELLSRVMMVPMSNLPFIARPLIGNPADHSIIGQIHDHTEIFSGEYHA